MVRFESVDDEIGIDDDGGGHRELDLAPGAAAARSSSFDDRVDYATSSALDSALDAWNDDDDDDEESSHALDVTRAPPPPPPASSATAQVVGSGGSCGCGRRSSAIVTTACLALVASAGGGRWMANAICS